MFNCIAHQKQQTLSHSLIFSYANAWQIFLKTESLIPCSDVGWCCASVMLLLCFSTFPHEIITFFLYFFNSHFTVHIMVTQNDALDAFHVCNINIKQNSLWFRWCCISLFTFFCHNFCTLKWIQLVNYVIIFSYFSWHTIATSRTHKTLLNTHKVYNIQQTFFYYFIFYFTLFHIQKVRWKILCINMLKCCALWMIFIWFPFYLI